MTSRIMQPTAASTLGIIAIVFITITATASEAENGGAIGLDINHPGGRSTEKDHRHFPDDERSTRKKNSNSNNNNNNKNDDEKEKVVVWPGSNVTVEATMANIETRSSSVFYPKEKKNFEVTTMITTIISFNPSRVKELAVDKERELLEDKDEESRLQRDQSEARAIARIRDDPTHEPAVTITPVGSHRRIPDDTGAATSIGDFTTATSLESRPENSVTVKASLLAPSRHEDPSTRMNGDEENESASSSASSASSSSLSSLSSSSNARSNELHRSSRLRLRLREELEEIDQEDQGSHFESSSLPIISVLATESIDRKDLKDIRAVSFQVPRPELANVEKQESLGKLARSNTNGASVGADDISKIDDSMKKLGEGRKDRSRAMNELPPGNEKSTKAFYEIKPSAKTELEKKNETRRLSITTSTQKTLLGGKFVLPSVDSAIGKFGPYFVDGDQEVNVTARIGSTVDLDCKIGLLGDKEVTWVQQDKDSFRLLTVGRIPYSLDQRIRLHYRYPSNWRLQILYASPRDSGLYKCQVTTHPPLVKKINVIVTAPTLTITDDSGRIVAKERHLKAGSALRLRCEARDVLESQNETVVWTRGDETLTEDVSENRTTEVTEGKEVLVIVSTLIVERATPRHAGNYSCEVRGIANTTIAVHVLNGELPAAVHDGNGVSRAVLNLWLIHLTVSYVFFR